MAGLYLHIPFCKRVCAYCDFYKSADLRPMKAVVEAMHDELRREAGFLPAEQLRTIYFGGGTPSLLPPRSWRSSSPTPPNSSTARPSKSAPSRPTPTT